MKTHLLGSFLVIKSEQPSLGGCIPTPLKNMSSSIGMMKFPIHEKIKNVPNHQPDHNYEGIEFVENKMQPTKPNAAM